ncbi:MAG: Tim44 domain-containing protein [Betaproteobacteria bacterium]|nr:MAG: Tim44 domain-containing protein [Betaproteobacteria bacterium]
MKRTSTLLLAAVAALTLGLSDFADARRMGGGRTLGAQRESVTPSRPAPAPTAPAGATASQPQPSAPAAGAAKAAPSPAPTPPPTGASRWLGPIAGLAAGLGLAALMSHFGLSEGFGSLLLIALGVLAAIFLVRMFLSRRQTAAPMQFAGASSNNAIPPSYETQPGPAWSGAEKPEPLMAAEPAAPAFGVARKPLPPGFDADGFAKEAKRQYIQIQRSYDNADRAALSSVMTAEMNAEIGREIDDRGTHQPTEIVTLDADVLEVTTENDKYWVSVRFTGLLREDGEPLPKSVDEIWNLTKPVNGSSGWLLAGISQLQ